MLDELPGAVARARVRYARHLAGAKRLKDALKEAEKARDEYDSHPTLKGSLEHAMSLNGVAGILERLGRYDAAVEAMGEAYRLAQSASDADEKRDGAGAAIEALESRGFAPSDTREKPFDARLFAVDAVSGPIVRRVAGASG